MTRPFTLEEQQNNNWFIPNNRLAILVGISNFNAVVTIKKKEKSKSLGGESSNQEPEYELVQALPNLYQAKQDCKVMHDCLIRYELLEKDIAKLYDDTCTDKSIKKTFDEISKRFRASKK